MMNFNFEVILSAISISLSLLLTFYLIGVINQSGNQMIKK